ncbi:STAS domain-containing protein [Streptomyces sp. NPDC095817]|uniref:STAS domain-containing protein n=1 Tax=Streptomyces sp. NPDC095817 TaxID=3155082 RepID=UPI00332AE5D5
MHQARLEVSRHTSGEVHVVALAGEIDHTTTGILRDALTTDGSYPRYTVLDFQGVTFMDSSGINVLVAANNAARRHDGWLRLAHTPQRVFDLLHIVGLDDVVALYSTVSDALAA